VVKKQAPILKFRIFKQYNRNFMAISPFEIFFGILDQDLENINFKSIKLFEE